MLNGSASQSQHQIQTSETHHPEHFEGHSEILSRLTITDREDAISPHLTTSQGANRYDTHQSQMKQLCGDSMVGDEGVSPGLRQSQSSMAKKEMEIAAGTYVKFNSDDTEQENFAIQPDEISKKTGFKKQKLYKKHADSVLNEDLSNCSPDVTIPMGSRRSHRLDRQSEKDVVSQINRANQNIVDASRANAVQSTQNHRKSTTKRTQPLPGKSNFKGKNKQKQQSVANTDDMMPPDDINKTETLYLGDGEENQARSPRERSESTEQINIQISQEINEIPQSDHQTGKFPYLHGITQEEEDQNTIPSKTSKTQYNSGQYLQDEQDLQQIEEFIVQTEQSQLVKQIIPKETYITESSQDVTSNPTNEMMEDDVKKINALITGPITPDMGTNGHGQMDQQDHRSKAFHTSFRETRSPALNPLAADKVKTILQPIPIEQKPRPITRPTQQFALFSQVGSTELGEATSPSKMSESLFNSHKSDGIGGPMRFSDKEGFIKPFALTETSAQLTVDQRQMRERINEAIQEANEVTSTQYEQHQSTQKTTSEEDYPATSNQFFPYSSVTSKPSSRGGPSVFVSLSKMSKSPQNQQQLNTLDSWRQRPGPLQLGQEALTTRRLMPTEVAIKKGPAELTPAQIKLQQLKEQARLKPEKKPRLVSRGKATSKSTSREKRKSPAKNINVKTPAAAVLRTSTAFESQIASMSQKQLAQGEPLSHKEEDEESDQKSKASKASSPTPSQKAKVVVLCNTKNYPASQSGSRSKLQPNSPSPVPGLNADLPVYSGTFETMRQHTEGSQSGQRHFVSDQDPKKFCFSDGEDAVTAIKIENIDRSQEDQTPGVENMEAGSRHQQMVPSYPQMPTVDEPSSPDTPAKDRLAPNLMLDIQMQSTLMDQKTRVLNLPENRKSSWMQIDKPHLLGVNSTRKPCAENSIGKNDTSRVTNSLFDQSKLTGLGSELGELSKTHDMTTTDHYKQEQPYALSQDKMTAYQKNYNLKHGIQPGPQFMSLRNSKKQKKCPVSFIKQKKTLNNAVAAANKNILQQFNFNRQIKEPQKLPQMFPSRQRVLATASQTHRTAYLQSESPRNLAKALQIKNQFHKTNIMSPKITSRKDKDLSSRTHGRYKFETSIKNFMSNDLVEMESIPTTNFALSDTFSATCQSQGIPNNFTLSNASTEHIVRKMYPNEKVRNKKQSFYMNYNPVQKQNVKLQDLKQASVRSSGNISDNQNENSVENSIMYPQSAKLAVNMLSPKTPKQSRQQSKLDRQLFIGGLEKPLSPDSPRHKKKILTTRYNAKLTKNAQNQQKDDQAGKNIVVQKDAEIEARSEKNMTELQEEKQVEIEEPDTALLSHRRHFSIDMRSQNSDDSEEKNKPSSITGHSVGEQSQMLNKHVRGVGSQPSSGLASGLSKFQTMVKNDLNATITTQGTQITQKTHHFYNPQLRSNSKKQNASLLLSPKRQQQQNQGNQFEAVVIGSGQDACVVNTNKMAMVNLDHSLVGRCLIANAGMDRNQVLMRNQMRYYHQQLYTFKISETGRRRNKFEVEPLSPKLPKKQQEQEPEELLARRTLEAKQIQVTRNSPDCDDSSPMGYTPFEMLPKGINTDQDNNVLISSPGSENDFEMKKIETLVPGQMPDGLQPAVKQTELLDAPETAAITEGLLLDSQLQDSLLNETTDDNLKDAKVTFQETQEKFFGTLEREPDELFVVPDLEMETSPLNEKSVLAQEVEISN